MLKLNNDIIILILQELKNDRNLYSCLLVNKFLCELVVPILWRDPWKYLCSRDIKKEQKRRTSLFKIVLLHLPDSSKDLLISNGINIIPNQQRKLFFDYIRYCKYICCFNDFYNQFELTTNSQKEILEQEIIKVFISRCTINCLNSAISNHPIYTFPGANICLSKVKEFQCISTSSSSFFYGLAEICKSIEKISISLLLHKSNPGISHLIKAQKKIKYLSVTVDDNDYNDYEMRQNDENENEKVNGMNTQHERIFWALKKHAHSILYFVLWIDNSFPFSLFQELRNLQTLILINDFRINQKAFEKQLSMALFPNLQALELSYISLSMVTNIIENTSGNLWKIKLENTIEFDNPTKYMQSICKHCSNIEYVSIFVNNQNMDKLKDFLMGCQQLEGIDIHINLARNEKFLCNKFFDILVRSAPTSLYKIKINKGNFTTKSLELFFNNWKNRKSLHLYPLIFWKDLIFDLFERYEVEGIAQGYMDHRFWCTDSHEEIEWR
ncbi:hypothetical protein C1645_818354 [Glomus cerebriforme]|uniref:F-box domain-containing protein n=1 Tax=Glomus cerebriforme TaxID=658196 RepID=A0A397THA3_9GLOM|nr:hypothetical protein C1645_818354 [Glomus cerebriforme]